MAIKIVIYFIIASYILVKPLFASSIVINELMPHPSPGSDWIEIYNPDSDNTNLSNWTLVDSTSTMKTLSGTIVSNGFATFDVTNRLNNSGDSIYLKDPSGNIIDNYSYNSDPGMNKSIGRSPDGGNWTVLASSSKGSSNGEQSSSTPTPTPKPTPTPTPKPTIKPSPTPSPTPTHTPTPTPTISPEANAPTSTPVAKSEGLSFIWARKIASSASKITSVAGVKTSATPEAQTIVENQKQNNPFIWIGLIFIFAAAGAVGYIYLKRNGKIPI